MTESPIILVVDDEPLIRQSLDTLLRSVGYQVRTFSSALDLYEDNSLPHASCLILDIRLPFTSGLDFQQRLTDRGVNLPVIFVTAHGDIPMTVRAMKAGAADFLSKPFRDQDILDAVASAVEKHSAFLGSSRTESDIRLRFNQLSPRERQIMAMATAGLMNKQIAGELGLSEITVKIHRGKVSRKMSAKTFADLVKMAELLGLSYPNLGK
ncbi:Two-component response regulator, FixJ family, consists of REC and HTH domains [Rhizobium sp. NFR07]|uniref:response regulator transcription factor n=1 Tax=Rhizobium sp. NFR07 TaxID=1566262 RepID=UPI0008EDD1C1|nr:response regulator [Rhizobium sp. NFR07]SFB16528.1 Two-component response regulator, FixJ family, consists of REC and HTH domains [Rhizobium sp. NFR07]